MLTLHLIANAHLDPVWLWDWRDGLNEGIITSRTLLDLMDEFPELTVIRGEAAIYQHIEKHDPETFARIRAMVTAGRWDVVGGTFVQPDTNLTGTETFARHFARSQSYFAARFGKPARVAWAADSFGHSGGLPDILAAAGMTGFACTRPDNRTLPIAKPAFWWEGVGGSRVLAYRPAVGAYLCERHTLVEQLDNALASAQQSDLDNVAVFYGLGDHGGGPTRRHLQEIRAWSAAHADVRVVHSGLHRLFAALRAEVADKGGDGFLPVHRGELNFCLRGCYVSVAKFKFAFRQAEAHAGRAETTATAIHASLGQPVPDAGAVWDDLLFNSFHDILPGSSMERAVAEQLDWLGGTRHRCRGLELDALNALATCIDTRRTRAAVGDRPGSVVFLAWNPHPHPYEGPVEFEANLDWRPIWDYVKRPGKLPLELLGHDGASLPFQTVATEHTAFAELPWRKRVVTRLRLPACGWNVLEVGWVEGANSPAVGCPAGADGRFGVTNRLCAVTAARGATGVQVRVGDRPLFGDAGLGLVTVEDAWGSWGGMGEEPESLDLSTVRHAWKISRVAVLERGSECAVLGVQMKGGKSRAELRFTLYREREAVDVAVRVFWNERSARLKLVMPAGVDAAEFAVPGGVVRRTAAGEVPGGRWVRAHGVTGGFGFASDALYGFDLKDGALRASICRASRYASDAKAGPADKPWMPVVDCGELKFQFLLASAAADLPRLARELEQPCIVLPIAPKPGALARQGSLAGLTPAHLQLLALKRAEDGNGLVVRVQEAAGQPAIATLNWLGQLLELGPVPSHGLASWRLTPDAAGVWHAVPCTASEEVRER